MMKYWKSYGNIYKKPCPWANEWHYTHPINFKLYWEQHVQQNKFALVLCSYLSCGLCKKCDGLGFRTNYTDRSSITCYNCPAKLVFFQKNFGNYSTPKRYEELTFESHLAQLCGHMYIK